MGEIRTGWDEVVNEQRERDCVEHARPHFLFLNSPTPGTHWIFCRFQQISLMFTLRSKVTQPRRKNLKKCPHNPGMEVMLATHLP